MDHRGRRPAGPHACRAFRIPPPSNPCAPHPFPPQPHKLGSLRGPGRPTSSPGRACAPDRAPLKFDQRQTRDQFDLLAVRRYRTLKFDRRHGPGAAHRGEAAAAVGLAKTTTPHTSGPFKG
eukprot:357204-Chlamydomonas_euryale.AAC.9